MGGPTFDSFIGVDYFGARAPTSRLLGLPVAGSVAAVAGQRAQHMLNRGFDSQYYRDMIVALVREHQPVSREDIDKLLLDKLPEVLTQEQKLNRVHNLLRQLADAGRIQNVGGRRWPKWVQGALLADTKQSKGTT